MTGGADAHQPPLRHADAPPPPPSRSPTGTRQIFGGAPLFNPQNGKLLKVTSPARSSPATGQIRGDAEIDDYYDASGAWLALKGKLDDGSQVEYRRV